MKQRDLSERLTLTEVRGTIVAMKPGNSGGAKGSRKMEGDMDTNMEKPPTTVPVAKHVGLNAAQTLVVQSSRR